MYGAIWIPLHATILYDQQHLLKMLLFEYMFQISLWKIWYLKVYELMLGLQLDSLDKYIWVEPRLCCNDCYSSVVEQGTGGCDAYSRFFGYSGLYYVSCIFDWLIVPIWSWQLSFWISEEFCLNSDGDLLEPLDWLSRMAISTM